jgi:hypothetical protein
MALTIYVLGGGGGCYHSTREIAVNTAGEGAELKCNLKGGVLPLFTLDLWEYLPFKMEGDGGFARDKAVVEGGEG